MMKIGLLVLLVMIQLSAYATSKNESCLNSGLLNLTNKMDEFCTAVSSGAALGKDDPKPVRQQIEDQLVASLMKIKSNVNDLNWSEKHGIGKDSKAAFIAAFFDENGQLNQTKVQSVVDHLVGNVQNCNTGRSKKRGIVTTTTVDINPNFEFQEPTAVFSGPSRKTAAFEYVKNNQFIKDDDAWVTTCRVDDTRHGCADEPQVKTTPLSQGDAEIEKLLENETHLRVGVFKPNSNGFKNPEKAKQVYREELLPYTKGEYRKLKSVVINTCSSMERNCKNGAGSGDDACRMIDAIKKYSDDDLKKMSAADLGFTDPKDLQAFKDLQEIIADKDGSLGYAEGVNKLYGDPSGLGYEADQKDDVGRELRTWLFLSALRGKAIRDMLKEQPEFKGAEFKVVPTGVEDEGFGFSNAAIMPGTCGGHFGGDQFFGKHCNPSEMENSCSRNVSAVRQICGAIQKKYANLGPDYEKKFQEFKKTNPGMTESNESRYSMFRYARVSPVVEDRIPPATVVAKTPGAKYDPGGECKVWCHRFNAYCDSVDNETPGKKIIGKIKTFMTAPYPSEKPASTRNRGSTKCPVNF